MINPSGKTEKFIQFGEGGFLRGFVDWMIQKLNDTTAFEGSVIVVQPIREGLCDTLSSQNCAYTHIIRGEEGVETYVIQAISRCIKPYEDYQSYLELAKIPTVRYIISNTTEAGIEFKDTDAIADNPPSTFPGKLTALLYARFQEKLPGFILLPCELNDRNGDLLKSAVMQYAKHWQLGDAFIAWINNENHFCNTLVDRINTGYPKGENIHTDFEDKMINTSEYFHLWVIETQLDLQAELPFQKAGLNVIVTKDALEMYRTRKVRILNGAHTSMVPYALLEGFDTVKSCMDDPKMHSFIRKCMFNEIIPTLDLPQEELEQYAEDVLTRFANPYIRHYLSSIALNSVSKFKVRVLPSILEYKKRFGRYPRHLTFAFQKLLEFYKTGMPNDDPEIINYIKTHSTAEILCNTSLWGTDISDLEKEFSEC